MPRDYLTRLLGVHPQGTPADWTEAARLVELHGLEGLAFARAREGIGPGLAGGVCLPPDLASRWEPVYRMQGLHATLLLESAGRARAALAGAGVPSLLFKGAALVADGTYPDAGARRMDDADLLVPPADAGLAVERLSDAGFFPVTPWSPERVGWAEALTFHDGAAPPGATLALDVHWRTRYDRLRFGGEEESALWDGADLERGLPAPEPHLVVGAEHLLKHLRFKVHLAAFGDLARLAGRVRDWDRVATLTGRSRLAAGIHAVLAILGRELGAPVPGGIIRGVPVRGLAEEISPRSLAGRVRPVGGRLSGIAWRWRLLGAPGRVASDLAEAVFPSNAWLRARYGRSGLTAWGRYAADMALWATYRGRSPASPHQELFDPRARE